ncbi:mechanosensitive ion channel family protein [Actinoalloteichus sp. AHMU CJ021]|uniref:Small conductance mechanosensitive channel n=1 Tax=Actinoalloteichus caeruleus DSM 43889 TaxID=1120930 RepID=A0ABT1JNM9_ACTCY|nr:mechanosensitive ion channel family protein [Actinoalloteichus caeruleus]AUS79953.1 mechanosensitive ion channel family protein [Actinoalloteichus sp. AHMU CJ021]MCP2334135.1 small conductance mechanosensitive channel [Actinoalloteichus caeruleus DSM 43889]
MADVSTVSPGPEPACVNEDGSICDRVFEVTGNATVAELSPLVVNGIAIALIVIAAFVLRWLVHRMISRATRGGGEGRVPALLAPLRERAPDALGPLLSERRAQRARTIGSVLKSVASFVIYGVAALMVLDQLGIQMAPILASAGVVGVAIGFGAQNLVRDFLSGMFMMLEDQYGVGDVVDLGDAIGTVEAVGLRVTTLRDLNGTVWYVRNGEVLRVGNFSQGFSVAVVDLPVAHTVPVDRAIQLALDTATEAAEEPSFSADVLEPPEMLGVDQITADTITIRLTVKVRPGRQWAVQRSLRARIKDVYDREGITAPYPAGRAFYQQQQQP